MSLSSRRWVRPCIVVGLIFCGALTLQGAEQYQATVGVSARVDQLVLPGPELVVKPLNDHRDAIVLRIVAAFPHGTAYRYDIEYYGLEPGTFDLRHYLQRVDGSSIEDLPALPVVIESVLPPGQIQPNEIFSRPSPSLGGYRLTLIVSAVIWLAGLLAILFWIRTEHNRASGAGSSPERPLSLADRLRPTVENAIAGTTSTRELAELERMLVAFWRKRLKLDHLGAADAFVVLREHREAGALLEQLEIWLHQPENSTHVNVAALLRPYQNLPADAMEAV